jgi:hypothetical protein
VAVRRPARRGREGARDYGAELVEAEGR